jgi:putative PIN family toxin of toxin-antitoxin system
VVLDVNVLISALLSKAGAPAGLVLRWLNGEFEVVVSEQLLAELSRAVGYPKIRTRVTAAEAEAFLQLLRATATVAVDPPAGGRRSRDPGDDYVVALGEAEAAIVVSGDLDLLTLADELPVLAPADFLGQLRATDQEWKSIQ